MVVLFIMYQLMLHQLEELIWHLRFIADAIKEATFSNPKPIEEHMAEQLILAAENDPNAPSVKKKNELERIAQASR